MPPRNILIVTSQPDRRAALESHLREIGYTVEVVDTASAAVEFGLAIVDTSDGSLWSVAEDLAFGRMLLIVDSVADLAHGFQLGADDCVVSAAQVEEIAARCGAILRRTGVRPDILSDEPVVYADRRLWVNFDSRQVWVGGRPAQLTPREFRLLRELLVHRDQTLTHEELLEEVWGRASSEGRTPEVLKQYIWRLRQKIEPDPNAPTMIVTDPGAGYRFVSRPQ